MARLIPEATDAELEGLTSRAEARVYKACRALPARWLILHGVRTLAPDVNGHPRDGEADFTLFDPDRGLLCIEVKGGTSIRYDPQKRKWYGRDPDGTEGHRRDPFDQAMKRKHDLFRLLTEAPEWRAAKPRQLLSGHAVLFPDIEDLSSLRRPDAPPEIVGGKREMRDLEGWIADVYAYWNGGPLLRAAHPTETAAIVEKVLAGAFSVQPCLGDRVVEDDNALNHWTLLQWEAMQLLKDKERVAIEGGAGTGKTVLATRRAQQLADEGAKVAFLCFNTPLADFLRVENLRWTRRGGSDRDRIDTMTFHAFARYWLQEIRRAKRRDHLAIARRQFPGADEHRVHIPMALSWALDDSRPEYDAIIIDEGQDFGETDWNAILTLSEDRKLAVFYDANQAIFRKAPNFPINAQQTFSLRRNCRNTDVIHDAAYAHYIGPSVERPRIVGLPLRQWTVGGHDEQAERIGEGVHGLIEQEKTRASDVAVLLFDARRRLQDYDMVEAALRRRGVAFVREHHGQREAVLLETAARFKGLESPIVVLWLNGELPEDDRRKLLYVAQSRARSLLVLVGTPTAITQ